ncbi:MAG: sulfatase-like hydrolase/transferase [Pirellulaceae bacterium]|nr:sulfatase-like hydrolase/transferase [Pirellulaceae bacterium]
MTSTSPFRKTILRSEILRALLFLFCTTCWHNPWLSFLTAIPAAEPQHPNIVMIMCDDLGWGDVGFNGNKLIATPQLDQWASQGLIFDRFYSAAPVCSPTRGSCLTGRHPYRYGIFTANRGHLKKKEITLAELLRQSGYATGHFGKWHLGTLTTTLRESNRGGPRGRKHFAPPSEHGFDICFSTEAKVPTWDPMQKPPKANNKWWAPIPAEQGIKYGTHYWDQRGALVTENLVGDDSRVIIDRVLPFFDQHAKNSQPFFAVIWLHAPHLPVVSGKQYTERYANYSKYEQHYFGCITALDDQMGRVRDALNRLKIANNTLVFFCADNGPEGRSGSAPGSARPFRGRKRDLFEGGIRVPAFVVWPRQIKTNQRTHIPAVTSDYLPTILDLLEMSPINDRPLDGTSLAPLLCGDPIKRQTGIGFQSANQAAWIEDRYKLLRRGSNIFLFDLIHDPSESKDIAADHKNMVNRMQKELSKWIDSCRHSNQGGDYES